MLLEVAVSGVWSAQKLAIGIVGALIRSWLLPDLGIHLGTGIVPAIIGATIGAIVLLLILRLAYRRGRW